MKKVISIILTVILAATSLIAFSACGSSSNITIAVPNDTTKEGRALLLLQELGYITLNEDAGITATVRDIESNPYNIEFDEVEAAQLPNILPDVDYAVINSNYAIASGLNPTEDALALEGSASAYLNVLAVKEGNENSDKIKALVAALSSAQVADFIEETYEAGIVLTGTEIKSVRQGKVSIKESYARVENGELIIYGMNINPYEQGNRFNVDPLRRRKLLLHKQEIRKLIGYTTQKGLTIVPLNMYINEKGLAKLEIGVARGKKNYDKRDDIAKRDAGRRMQQAMKRDAR